MERGYIKVWRKIIDSPVWNDPSLFRTWAWCLIKANHKPQTVSVKTGRGSMLVDLHPGQFIFGRNTAAAILELPPSTIRDQITRLYKLGMIDQKPDTHFSIISIMNWDNYQIGTTTDTTGNTTTNRQPTDNQPTTNRHREECKEVKNEKKKPEVKIKSAVHGEPRTSGPKTFVKPTIEEVAAYCVQRQNGIDAEEFVAHYESNGWRVGRNPMKSWHGAVITWEKDRKKRKTTTAAKQGGENHFLKIAQREALKDEQDRNREATGTVQGGLLDLPPH